MKVTPYRLVGLDTAVFIYYFNQHPRFGPKAKAIFAALAENRLKALTSTISLAELLALKAQRDEIRQLHQEVLELPNFSFLPVDEAIATEAARIRRDFGFRLPDALQLATTKLAKAQAFITNDKRLKRFSELDVILLTTPSLYRILPQKP